MGTFVFFLILFGIVGAIAYKVVTNKKAAAPTTTTTPVVGGGAGKPSEGPNNIQK
jgi:hypothetical protein